MAVERFDGPILVFDAGTGTERFTLGRPKSHCTAFGFSPDGRHLAYLAPDGPDHVLRVVDVASGRPVEKDLKPRPGRAFFNSHALAFFAGRQPAGRRRGVRRRPGRPLGVAGPPVGAGHGRTTGIGPLVGLDGMIEAVRFTGDGSEVLAVGGTKVAVGWWWDTGKESRRRATGEFVIDLLATGNEHEAFAGWSASLNKALRQRLPAVASP